MPYLSEDIKGPASDFEYGKKGKEIQVIRQNDHMLLVVDNEGSRFWVNEDQITEVKPLLDEVKEEVKPPAKGKGRKAKQNSLF
jgi:hypothetical protein